MCQRTDSKFTANSNKSAKMTPKGKKIFKWETDIYKKFLKQEIKMVKRHMKRCSTSPIPGAIKMRYNFLTIRLTNSKCSCREEMPLVSVAGRWICSRLCIFLEFLIAFFFFCCGSIKHMLSLPYLCYFPAFSFCLVLRINSICLEAHFLC